MNTKNNSFDYYYGNESEQFSFFRIPRYLVQEDQFKNLSNDSKLLYGMMLDRMGVSRRNNWLDEETNRVFIIFSIEEICNKMNIGKTKAIKVTKELEEIGLIEKERKGQGNPNRIYVKNFVKSNDEDNINLESSDADRDIKKEEINKKSENNTFRGSESEPLEVRNKETNYIDNSYNELNNISSIHSQTYELAEKPKEEKDKDLYVELLKTQLEYDLLIQDDYFKSSKGIIDGIINIIADISAFPTNTIRVNRQDKPYDVVKSRLLKINYSILCYVLDTLKDNTTEIRNQKNYLITTIYNAFDTIDFHYQSKVNHDFYGYKNYL